MQVYNMEQENESKPPTSLLLSLPKDIVLSILARVSTSYYPTLSLVSKSFRSLIISEEFGMVRSQLGTREVCVYVCIQSTSHLHNYRRWFSLWIKPDDHQTLAQCYKTEGKSTRNLLLPMPSSYSLLLPISQETIGSETYEIGGQNSPTSSDVWVYNKLTGKRRKAPSMTVARKNPMMFSFDEKLYVMGGCEAEESTHWAEVYDPKTQTWEPLADPGAEIRFSLNKKLNAHQGKAYVSSNKKSFFYNTSEGRWVHCKHMLGKSICKMGNVFYGYAVRSCRWFDMKCRRWKKVKGLFELDEHFVHGSGMEIGSYGGKLVIFWVSESWRIWCAVINIEKRVDGEVWGHVEWVDIVLTVPPWSQTLLLCVELMQ